MESCPELDRLKAELERASAQRRQALEKVNRMQDEQRRLSEQLRACGRRKRQAPEPERADAGREYMDARAKLKQARVETEAAKEELGLAAAQRRKAGDEFHALLRKMTDEARVRLASDRELMDRAGIPHAFRKNCTVRREPDGAVLFSFGCLGEGRAQVVMDAAGAVTCDPEAFGEGSAGFSAFEKKRREFLRQRRRRSAASASDAAWKLEVEHGRIVPTDEEVTIKMKQDGSEILIARGHLPDIQPNVDHAHVWNLKEGMTDLRDLRRSPPLFPED